MEKRLLMERPIAQLVCARNNSVAVRVDAQISQSPERISALMVGF
jgi:hypothetical protein